MTKLTFSFKAVAQVIILISCFLYGMFCIALPAHPDVKIFGMFSGGDAVWISPKSAKITNQNWNHYSPSCELKNKALCKERQLQTKNIVRNGTYDNINVASDRWMVLANRAALVSVKSGGGPFGAVILQVDDKTHKVIRYWVSHNQVVANEDPTAHAEISTIREAAKDLGVVDLGHINKSASKLSQPGVWSHCIIYSSAEPCPMCLSAIYWAGIDRLYFAATRYDAAVKGVSFSDAMIYQELKKPYSARRHMTVRHVITDNSLDAFNYFKRHRVARYGQKPSGS